MLIEHAKRELELAGLYGQGEYEIAIANAVMKLIEVFAEQGHSGHSASIVCELFHTLAKFQVLTPVEGNNDEWIEVGKGIYQNCRLASLFKENGVIEYSNAIVWKDEKGRCFGGMVEGISSSQSVKNMPFIPKTFYIDVYEKEGKSYIKDKSQLEAVKEVYDLNIR